MVKESKFDFEELLLKSNTSFVYRKTPQLLMIKTIHDLQILQVRPSITAQKPRGTTGFPECKSTKKRLQTSIVPGLISGVLRYAKTIFATSTMNALIIYVANGEQANCK